MSEQQVPVQAPAGASQLNLSATVFLGGSCDPTTWRTDIAIPALTAAGISFGNPQIADYDATNAYFKSQGYKNGIADVEAKAKDNAKVLLFVIDGQTRAIVSMLEAVDLSARGKKVVLVIQNMPDGTVIRGQTVTGRELTDLNNARGYCLAMASATGAMMCDTVEEAVEKVIELAQA